MLKIMVERKDWWYHNGYKILAISGLLIIACLAISCSLYLYGFLTPTDYSNSGAKILDPKVNHWGLTLWVEFLTGLGFSFIYSFLFLFLYGKYSQRRLQDKMITHFGELFRKWFPTEHFHDDKSPSIEFNNSMKEKLLTTKEYWYSGDTGHSSSKRVFQHFQAKNARNTAINISFFLVDPRLNEVLDDAAKVKIQRDGLSQNSDKIKDAKRILLIEFVQTILLLAWTNIYGEVTVYLRKNIPTFYIHHFEGEGVYLGFYLKGEYPQTFFYQVESPFYSGIRNDLKFESGFYKIPIRIHGTTSVCDRAKLRGDKAVALQHLETILKELLPSFQLVDQYSFSNSTNTGTFFLEKRGLEHVLENLKKHIG